MNEGPSQNHALLFFKPLASALPASPYIIHSFIQHLMAVGTQLSIKYTKIFVLMELIF